jgi:hypothetical protein
MRYGDDDPESSDVPMNDPAAALRRFRLSLMGMMALLVAQYVLGMAVNLYVQFPSDLPGGNAWQWAFANSALIGAHIVVGTGILVLAVVALALSISARITVGRVAAVLGLVMILVAFFSGATFLSSGQQAVSSFLMALGFLGSLLAYGVGLAVTRPAAVSAPR